MIPLHTPLITPMEIWKLPKEDYFESLKGVFLKHFCKENIVFTADARNGLFLALKIMKLKRQDEILMPAYICNAVHTVINSLCTPVCVDVDPQTFNIDPDQIEKNITENTKGIIVAHLYGNPCEMDKIMEIAKNHKLKVIEDCAQSLGSVYKDTKVGTFGDFAVLSFRFSKDITSFRGGAVLTNTRINCISQPTSFIKIFPWLFTTVLALNQIRNIPSPIYSPLHNHILVPIFSRNATKFIISSESLCNYQCYLITKQMERLQTVIEKRRQNASFFSSHLSDMVKTPIETKNGYHTYYRYTIQCDKREKMLQYLMAHGIEADKMYDYSLSNLPNSLIAANNNINIPVHHELSNNDKNKIIEAIHEYH